MERRFKQFPPLHNQKVLNINKVVLEGRNTPRLCMFEPFMNTDLKLDFEKQEDPVIIQERYTERGFQVSTLF